MYTAHMSLSAAQRRPSDAFPSCDGKTAILGYALGGTKSPESGRIVIGK